jgi:glycosyl transferase, family 25
MTVKLQRTVSPGDREETMGTTMPARGLRAIDPQTSTISINGMTPPRKTFETVVISVNRAHERRANITAMLRDTKLDWTFFNAHESLRQKGLKYDLRDVKRAFGRSLSPAQIAVGSSHVAVLSAFLERNSADYILVLEDDIILDGAFPVEMFTAFCREKEIDYIRLFGKHYAKAVRLGFFFDRSIIRFKTTPTGMQAYLMSRRGAEIFVDSFSSVDQPIDLIMDSFWKTGLPLYSIFPYPVIERYSPTSIPIPDARGELNAREQIARNICRVTNKVRKTWANFRLRKTDKQIGRRLGPFQQIFDT